MKLKELIHCLLELLDEDNPDGQACTDSEVIFSTYNDTFPTILSLYTTDNMKEPSVPNINIDIETK